MPICFSASVASLTAVATKAVAELHEVTADVALDWLVSVSPEEIKESEQGQFATRDGIAVFHVGRMPTNAVQVAVRIERMMTIGDNETWIGKYVSCSTVINDNNWSCSYNLDWKTGNKRMRITLGKYPFAHIKPT